MGCHCILICFNDLYTEAIAMYICKTYKPITPLAYKTIILSIYFERVHTYDVLYFGSRCIMYFENNRAIYGVYTIGALHRKWLLTVYHE